jgi:hypothetical protein
MAYHVAASRKYQLAWRGNGSNGNMAASRKYQYVKASWQQQSIEWRHGAHNVSRHQMKIAKIMKIIMRNGENSEKAAA